MVHVSVCTFWCVRSGNRRSIEPEVVHQRLVVQVGSSRHLAEWAISPSGRFRARGTCVRVHIFVRTERNLSVDRARGGLSESCRTSCRRHLVEWASSPGGRCRARGTCVRVHILVRIVRNLSVDRARGGASESCRTSRLQPPLSRVGDSARWKVSSTWYMCPCAHFRAYGEEFVGRSRPRWCIRDLSYKSTPAAS